MPWPADSVEGKAAARVVKFVAAAHQVEAQAMAPGIGMQQRFAKYHKELEEHVGVHCPGDCCQALAHGG